MRSGRIYYNVKGKEVHQASAPGQPPAPLSGDLIASVDHKVVEDSSKRWEGVTYSDLPYSYILELIGHPKGSPEEARPAWLDTLYENIKDYEEIATEGFKRR